MAGFGSLGGLGGRSGGFGASFPSRSGAPNSQVVDYLRPQDEWQKDWDARYAAEQGRARAPGMVFNPGPETNLRPGAPTGAADWTDPTGISTNWGAGVNPFSASRPDAPTGAPGWVDSTGISNNWGMPSNPNAVAPTVYNDTFDAGYVPDFTALNKEREQMMGRYDAQARNQQAYDWMNGGGQINGILGPNYSDPNFGQIVGAQPQGPSQEEMAWADGLYNPTGTYGTAPARNSGWSIW